MAGADDDPTDFWTNVLMLKAESRNTLCLAKSSQVFDGHSWVSDDFAACQGTFASAPGPAGTTVGTDGDRKINWAANMNMPGSQATTFMIMTYGQTLNWGNWRIYPDEAGTRFENIATGHGMYVSTTTVNAF